MSGGTLGIHYEKKRYVETEDIKIPYCRETETDGDWRK
jgi:hypothetical protein